MRRIPVIALLVGLASCTAGSGGGSSPPALAYGVPNPASVAYETVGYVEQAVEMMGSTQTMGGEVTMTLDASFEASPNGVRVTMEVTDAGTDFSGMGGAISADEGDVDGSLVFELSRTGDVVVEAAPTVTGGAEQAFQFTAMAHTLFPKLPGTAIEAGATWSGTGSYEAEEGGGFNQATMAAEYTAVGDTVVDGVSLLKVAVAGSTELVIAMDQQGMTVEVAIETEDEGFFLWDASAGLMVESVLVSEGLGTASIDAFPEAIPIAVSGETTVRLVRE